MADFYWIGTTGAENWDDNFLGVSPWSDTSGGVTNGLNPSNGDNVYFDSNSINAPATGTTSALSLAILSTAGFNLTMPNYFANITVTGTLTVTQGTIFNGTLGNGATGNFSDSASFTGTAGGICTLNFAAGSASLNGTVAGSAIIVFGSGCTFAGGTVGDTADITFNSATFSNGASIGNGATLAFNGTSVCGGSVGSGASAAFNDFSSTLGTASFNGTLTTAFGGTSTNSCTTFNGSGNSITFADGSSNIATFTVVGTVSFYNSAANGAGLIITATSFTVLGNLSGGGTLVGAVTISGSSDNLIIGAVTNTGTNTGTVTGDMAMSGGAHNSAQVNGVITMTNADSNTGICSTLVVPYSTGAGVWGSFNQLVLTGLKTPGIGGLPFVS